MNRTEYYNSRKKWIYPLTVIATLKKEIKGFYNKHNKQLKHHERIRHFNNENTFYLLYVHIQTCTALEQVELPKPSWLQDFYNGLKDETGLNKRNVEVLLTTFGLKYDPVTDKLNEVEVPQAQIPEELIERNKILHFITSKTRRTSEFRAFVGKYKYFAGAKKDSIYDYIYEYDLEIFESGKAEIHSSYNNFTYMAFAMITSNGNLQISSYSFDQSLLGGIGKILTFLINKYQRLAILIPGMGMTFDADEDPIATQTLLSTDLSHTKNTPIIRDYFDNVVSQLRMYTPKLSDVEKLKLKYHNDQR